MSLMTGANKSYHHGDLRNALLHTAEEILETQGIGSLTLRATARKVGVTHTAPANHFGDLTGLLSELAADGFRRFTEELQAASESAAPDPRARGRAVATAYCNFARQHPGLFTLMFRHDRLDTTRPSLKEAIEGSRNALRSMVAERSPDVSFSPLEAAARATALWSLIHGFSTLLLEGRLAGILNSLPPEESPESLLEAMLDTVVVR
jgi:AcrR family transcriptional regulator